MITSNVKLSEKDKAIFDLIIEDLKNEAKDVTLDNIKAHSLFNRIEQKGIFTKMIPISISVKQNSRTSFEIVISGTGIDLSNSLHSSYLTKKANEFIMNLAGFVQYLNDDSKDHLLKMVLAEINASCKKN